MLDYFPTDGHQRQLVEAALILRCLLCLRCFAKPVTPTVHRLGLRLQTTGGGKMPANMRLLHEKVGVDRI